MEKGSILAARGSGGFLVSFPDVSRILAGLGYAVDSFVGTRVGSWLGHSVVAGLVLQP